MCLPVRHMGIASSAYRLFDPCILTAYAISVRRVATTACVTMVIAASLMSCAMDRHREQIRQGLLARGLHRGAFLQEWGLPSRTFAVPACNPALRADPYATSWPVYEVWEYQARATCLTFDGVRLLLWKTGISNCEPRQPCEPEGIPPPEYPGR